MTISISTWLSDAATRIVSHSPALDAELLLAWRLQKNRAYLRAFAEQSIPTLLLPTLQQDIDRLAEGYPLAYLMGKKAFWDMDLIVNEATLIPRSDTETLIEAAIQYLSADFNGTIIDLGTGSGAIAIALSRVFPQATIYAADISTAALAVAQENAKHWQKSEITFVHSDWLTPLDKQSLPTLFDVIISNPPYIEEDDKHLPALQFEPLTALSAPQHGLAAISSIIEQADVRLSHGGRLIIEHGYNQADAVPALLNTAGWQALTTHRDLSGQPRMTTAVKK